MAAKVNKKKDSSSLPLTMDNDPTPSSNITAGSTGWRGWIRDI